MSPYRTFSFLCQLLSCKYLSNWQSYHILFLYIDVCSFLGGCCLIASTYLFFLYDIQTNKYKYHMCIYVSASIHEINDDNHHFTGFICYCIPIALLSIFCSFPCQCFFKPQYFHYSSIKKVPSSSLKSSLLSYQFVNIFSQFLVICQNTAIVVCVTKEILTSNSSVFYSMWTD